MENKYDEEKLNRYWENKDKYYRYLAYHYGKKETISCAYLSFKNHYDRVFEDLKKTRPCRYR